MSDDHTVRLESPGPIAWSNAEGLRASQEDPYITGLSEERAMWLVENRPFEHADSSEAEGEPTITDRVADVLSGTLEDLDDALASGEFDDHLDRLESYEQEHKDREGAHNRINDRRDELNESE